MLVQKTAAKAADAMTGRAQTAHKSLVINVRMFQAVNVLMVYPVKLLHVPALVLMETTAAQAADVWTGIASHVRHIAAL